ncbi:MAG: hypothetical protein IPI11_00035 [Haliscomenobacter sp.]|nr:hypothetical protein [Haliscomenobacter sp.]
MFTDERQILIYYNPDLLAHRQTVAHAQSMAAHVEAYAFEEAHLNQTRWEEILELLDVVDPRMILNEADPYFQAELKDHDFDRLSWLKILSHRPNLVKSPIAIRGDHAILCCLPKEVGKLMPKKVDAL